MSGKNTEAEALETSDKIKIIVSFAIAITIASVYVGSGLFIKSNNDLSVNIALDAFNRNTAGRNPEGYLASLAVSNNGIIANPVLYAGRLHTNNTHINPDVLGDELRQCIVGAVGVTPIPMTNKTHTDISYDVDLLVKYGYGFRVLSQSQGITYATVDIPDNLEASINAGSKRHPLALSTQCMSFFFWRVNIYAALIAKESGDMRKQKDGATVKEKAEILSGEKAFENSTHAGQ